MLLLAGLFLGILFLINSTKPEQETEEGSESQQFFQPAKLINFNGYVALAMMLAAFFSLPFSNQNNKNRNSQADYQVVIGGEQEEVYRSFRSLMLAMLLAVVLIYMIMAAQFESLRFPFIILLDIPLTLASICIIFWITGFGLNVISFIGLIVLAGIAVNDSIVKVDFINQRRREGCSVREAIFDASEKRFRPIIMTSITTILGLLPMAIGFGEGAELQRPLALAMLLGLFISTIVTLLAVPVFYTYLAGEKS